MKDYPCKGCTSRAVGCHAACEKYKAAKEGWSAAEGARRAVRRIESDILEMDTVSMRHNGFKRYDRKW